MSFPYKASKMYPANHKTVFVLDHTPYFGISCESPIEFDFLKSRTPGFIPLNPISKSLWTCSVESAIEYCRIVWDLFPHGKLVRFIASDDVAHILNGWSSTQQNLNHIMNGMSLIGIPPPPRSGNSHEYTVIHGLRAAIDALSEFSDLQTEKCTTDASTKILNRCRVICITSARDDDSMKRLEEIFHNVLQQQNRLTMQNDRLLFIDHCHLVIINTFPVTIESQVNNHPLKSLSSILSTEVHSIKATQIPHKLSALILEHYDLASTTVTGIPMKEEQNASSSANYDVEIYHASNAHISMLGGNDLDKTTIKDNGGYQTITLKWCTPRSCSTAEMQHCTSMDRITPVDVNSRPSLCLINFLLGGRSVMLEMARKSGGKLTSHLLAAHGGEIFIHTLCTARSVLEDPPSISEGSGGRVTDYRIPDLGSLIMKPNRLVALKSGTMPPATATAKMKQKLQRQTKYWPLTINSTIIFNLKRYNIDTLSQILTKDVITDDEVIQCKQVIYNLIGLESKHESLHLMNVGLRIKGQKSEKIYKIMWNELGIFIKNNLHSENHKAIYNCLLECHKFNLDGDGNAKIDVKSEFSSDNENQRASVIRATTDSPMSPPPVVNTPVKTTFQHRTLLEMFQAQEKSTKYREDFSGRISNARLYPNIKEENERKSEAMVIE